MPNKLNLKTQRGILGGFRGSQIKKSGRLSNGWTDWHQIWYTSADSSGNGHRGHLGGFRGSNIQKSGDAVKRLDRLAPTLVHVCRFIWEWA